MEVSAIGCNHVPRADLFMDAEPGGGWRLSTVAKVLDARGFVTREWFSAGHKAE